MKKVAGVSIGLFSALTVGLVLLLLGVGALFGLTDREHDEALAQVQKDRGRLEMSIQRQLFADLSEVRRALDDKIAAALADPFADSDDLVLFEGGRKILPRVVRADGPGTVDEISTLLASPAPAEDHAAIPLTPEERARIGLARRAAIEPDAYQAWLVHCARYRVSAAVEVATMVFVIEGLDRTKRLAPELAKALFRDGVTLTEGHVPGFYVTLLYGDEPMSRAASGRLVDRAQKIAEAYLVKTDDVFRRWYRPERRRLDDINSDWTITDFESHRHRVRIDRALSKRTRLNPRAVDCAEGSCLVVEDGSDLRGGYLDLERWTSRLNQDWHKAQLLPEDARIVFETTSEEPKFSVQSRQWRAAERLATERFVLKASGLGVVALLGIGVFVMAIMLQRRRTAYIELRGQLISAVTHELKTPLASISALAQTLEMRYGSEPQARDYATRIVTSADRLGYLVDNVLSFTRLERGAWKPRFETMHPSEIATLLAEPIARAARPVDLKLDLDDVPFVADRELVRLMLSNLVDNAAKYATAERVAITVSLSTTDKTTLHFSDDGPGLGERDPRRLFDDFRRGKVDDVRGTGLGLSICRWVARLHGGNIAVEETSTSGTKFLITLAKHKPAPQQATRRP